MQPAERDPCGRRVAAQLSSGAADSSTQGDTVVAVSRQDRRSDEQSLVPFVDRIVEHRYGAAVDGVATLRGQFPDDSPEELANRLIRRYAKDMALGGAVSGGAAASPVAGVAVAAASAGADATFSVGRLGEMIMAIGMAYGHDTSTVDQRRAAIVTIMGLADGAAIGVSGLAARAGAKGGARVLQRIPSTPAPATATVRRKALSKLGATRGPWSLTALIPYGIGAGVGAAGNALLARTVGRAAKEYFAGHSPTAGVGPRPTPEVVEVLDDETELLEPDPTHSGAAPSSPAPGTRTQGIDDDIVDAEIVE